jgi:hypothetical protein
MLYNSIYLQCSASQKLSNPFNPTTTIKYSIAHPNLPKGEAIVQLKVYDTLGKEAATLINEEQKPGYYEVKWDASDQPSGVYFYRITLGDPSTSSGQGYAETKKMVFIK